MKEQEEQVNKFNDIKNTLKQIGCSNGSIESLFQNNFSLLEQDNNISENFYFIFNNTNLYAILMVQDNNYSWSLYENDSFSLFLHPKDENTWEDSDYIVEMMLHFADTEKVQKIIPGLSKKSIEEKVKALKRTGLNSHGYHFR